MAWGAPGAPLRSGLNDLEMAVDGLGPGYWPHGRLRRHPAPPAAGPDHAVADAVARLLPALLR